MTLTLSRIPIAAMRHGCSHASRLLLSPVQNTQHGKPVAALTMSGSQYELRPLTGPDSSKGSCCPIEYVGTILRRVQTSMPDAGSHFPKAIRRSSDAKLRNYAEIHIRLLLITLLSSPHKSALILPVHNNRRVPDAVLDHVSPFKPGAVIGASDTRRTCERLRKRSTASSAESRIVSVHCGREDYKDEAQGAWRVA